MHRRSAAEKAIRTFKNHLLSELVTCNKHYSFVKWDRILSQTEIALNLLRDSRLNHYLSAWAYIKQLSKSYFTSLTLLSSNLIPTKEAAGEVAVSE